MVQRQTKQTKVVLIEPNGTLRRILELQFRLAKIELCAYADYQLAISGLAQFVSPYPDIILVSLEPVLGAYDIAAAIEATLPTARLIVMMPPNDELFHMIHRNTSATILQKPFDMKTLKQMIGMRLW